MTLLSQLSLISAQRKQTVNPEDAEEQMPIANGFHFLVQNCFERLLVFKMRLDENKIF